MTFEERMTEFTGLPIAVFPRDLDGRLKEAGAAADEVAWRIALDEAWQEYETDVEAELDAVFEHFVDRVDPSRVRALVFGPTVEDDEQDQTNAVLALSSRADRFPALRAVFLGDVLREESEVSWLRGAPFGVILDAFPALEVLGARGDFGGNTWDGEVHEGPASKPVSHQALRRLILESGGLSPTVIRGVLDSDLPSLEHLELYLGEPNYGGTASVADLAPLLSGELFPNLRSLGLRDSVIQDEIAAALADAPLVARLETLDLSLGTLGDEGVRALLDGQSLTHLRKLDLHHHYVSAEAEAELRSALPGVEIDLGHRQEPGHVSKWNPSGRYIAISE